MGLMAAPNITAEHVRRAFAILDEQGVPASRKSIDYAVEHEGKRYPPSYTVCVAQREATGVEPGFDEVSSENARSLLQSLGFAIVSTGRTPVAGPNTKEQAAKVFAKILPDEVVRTALAGLMADVIRHAHAKNPASWIVSLRSSGRINLTVGRLYTVVAAPKQVYVYAQESALSAEARDLLGRVAKVQPAGFRTFPDSVEYIIPPEHLPAVAPSLTSGLRGLVDAAANAVRQTPSAVANNVGALEYIEELLGTSLPRPEYRFEAAQVPASPQAGWVFAIGSGTFDVRGAVAQLDELSWPIHDAQASPALGDAVFLCEAGDDGDLLARCTVIGALDNVEVDPAEEPFWREEAARPDQVRSVRLRVDRRDAIPRSSLLADPSLQDSPLLRAGRPAYYRLSAEELSALGAQGKARRKVVKIAPGESARFWEDCRLGGYVCVGWDELGDLRRYSSFDELRAAYVKVNPGKSAASATRKSKELWTLRELRPGDLVVANRGISEVVGVGEVVAPGYRWREDRPEFKHTVAIRWTNTDIQKIPSQDAWAMITVGKVAPEVLAALKLGGASPPAIEAPASTPIESVLAQLRKAKLFFPEELVCQYLAALQTKRFVLLTGISGTGKTRLAQAIAQHFRGRRVEQRAVELPEGAVELRASKYMFKYRRFIVPARLAGSIVLEGPGPWSMRLHAEGQSWMVTLGADKPLTVLLRRDAFAWFNGRLKEGDAFALEAIATDAGNELRITVPSERDEQVEVSDNYEVIAVRPDWTDGRPLLGYFNPITEGYTTTPFLRLMLRARDEEERARKEKRSPVPFFVVLDEMNLARVEQYFADFLSAMESEEPIDLHDRPEEETQAGAEEDTELTIPPKLRVPSNLFFTGTVNIDETTHMFSPKVLDRAFVMEFNSVDLGAHARGDVPPSPLRLNDMRALVFDERPSTDDWSEFSDLLGGALRDVVLRLNAALATENRHFGYRVANEVGAFVNVFATQANKEAATLWAALDLAVHSKVLPKLHGTQQELGPILNRLFSFAVHGAEVSPPAVWTDWHIDGGKLAAKKSDAAAEPRLPRTADKLLRMLQRLQSRGFTSYIE